MTKRLLHNIVVSKLKPESKLKKKKGSEVANFNRTHPEIKRGEIFYANVRKGKTYCEMRMVERGPETGTFYPKFKRVKTNSWDDFNELPFKTKRFGEKAYKSDGKLVRGARPVFVKRKELEKSYPTYLFELEPDKYPLDPEPKEFKSINMDLEEGSLF